MIYKNSHKLLSKLKYFTYLTNYSRILNFKRPKWKFKQKLLKRWLKKISRVNRLRKKRRRKFSPATRKKTRLFNIVETVLKAKSLRYKYIKKERRFINLAIDFSFGSLIPTFFFKSILKKNISKKIQLALTLLVKPFFRLELLVWRLGFFNTIRQARASLFLGNIMVNQRSARHNFVLKKDDIVHVNTLASGKNRSFAPIFLWEMLEVDYYLNNILLIKDSNRFDNNILYFLYFDSYLNYIVNS
jgi:ribosomal protein S4